MREITAARIVEPLRRGSSVPLVVDDTDGVRWLVKLRGAGQGPAALVAEVVAARLADVLGLGAPVPARALVRLGPDTPTDERDSEILDLLARSHGVNLAFAWLPDAVPFERTRAAHAALAPPLAAALVAFDTLLMNTDRTAKNPNLLFSGARLWSVDHGAALVFHVRDERSLGHAAACVRGHVLAAWTHAPRLAAALDALAMRLDEGVLRAAVAGVPPELAVPAPGLADRLVARWRRRAAWARDAVAAAVAAPPRRRAAAPPRRRAAAPPRRRAAATT